MSLSLQDYFPVMFRQTTHVTLGKWNSLVICVKKSQPYIICYNLMLVLDKTTHSVLDGDISSEVGESSGGSNSENYFDLQSRWSDEHETKFLKLF